MSPVAQSAGLQAHAPPEHVPRSEHCSCTVHAPFASFDQHASWHTHEPSSSLQAPPAPQSRMLSQMPSRLSKPHLETHWHWPPGPPAAVGSCICKWLGLRRFLGVSVRGVRSSSG